MADVNETITHLLSELRRGTIVISVLSQLATAQYGYSLVQTLEEKGSAIDPSTLYPLLRRLEKQGLLESEWDTQETRPRKYYKRSAHGDAVYVGLCKEWTRLVKTMDGIIEVNNEGGRPLGDH
ncbi:PadR family transcriptional regulator [Aureibacillus halotolerans]|uniref:DNA-binding PadR family transcriptional regulator n=1 Tax=Aureibacillus halotolerans TaxID=1508390 RepID=A0A4R6U0F3_9BACI|nr:PadR family transcriptional regulator [Aureibacillus halotolerans]TDQ39788.1 DNA-binding PadR family transcriptional regulator [Aureibacillus halotolerans]